MEYCLCIDLVNSMCNIQELTDSSEPPLQISFPFDKPEDWEQLDTPLDCPVVFGADEACLSFQQAMDDTPLPRANPLMYKSYVAIAEKLSLMLADEVNLTERVTRLLWAYTPPPGRAEVARQLAMSERNLTRQLAVEGSTYAGLLADVQEERARNFLRKGHLSISEIGYRLGYAEPAAFTRAFTRWTGVSPLKWRQRHAP